MTSVLISGFKIIFKSMLIKTIKPCKPLDEYIESYIYIEGNNKGTSLPKTNMSMVFNLGDAFKLFHDNSFRSFTNFNKHWLAGIQTKPNYVESYGTSRMFTIQFKTIGCYAFFKEPLSLFKNEFVTLDNLFANEAEEIWERLIAAQNLEEKVVIVENFLLAKLIKRQSKNRKIESINAILKNFEISSVNNISTDLNTSRKHLHHLFNNFIGVSPKNLLSIIRLNSTFQTLSKTRPNKLSYLAYELDYTDQAHFNKNFKQFTDLRPTEYISFVKSFSSMKNTPHYIPILTR
jgi:AraC-like DNA-binding protein